MAIDDGVDVVVEMLTGCGVGVAEGMAEGMADGGAEGGWMRVVVVVVVEGGWVVVDAATRIQHLTPRLRPRAPSTPAELVIPGFVMN